MTMRWENVPISVKMWHGDKHYRIEQPILYESALINKAIADGKLHIARHVPPLDPDVNMMEAAITDLRAELSETRTERDRAQARCAELEARMQTIREVVK